MTSSEPGEADEAGRRRAHTPWHPSQPQHPDFWRISDALPPLVDLENPVGPGDAVDPLLAAEASPEVVDHIAQTRARHLHRRIQPRGALDPQVTALVAQAWRDAFGTGVRFQQAGGHQRP